MLGFCLFYCLCSVSFNSWMPDVSILAHNSTAETELRHQEQHGYSFYLYLPQRQTGQLTPLVALAH